MIYKSYIIEQNLQPIEINKLFLFYGENNGLKKEFKDKLKKKFIKYENLNYYQEEIIKDKDLLVKEITNKSLFNNKKLIFIEQANDKLLPVIEEILEKIKEEKVFIFSSILDKKSKLRNSLEKSKDCGVVACYADNEITIRKIILEKLNKFKNLNSQIVNLILENTGLDRNKVYNEIEKINICFQDKTLDLDKVNSLLNLNTNEDFNLLKDEALKGNKINTNKLLSDTVFENDNMVYYLNSINQRIGKLYDLEIIKKREGQNIKEIISNFKPPIFWKEKNILEEQSKKWSLAKLKYAMKKIYNAEIKIKSHPSIRKDLLIKNLIVELCTDANSF